MQEDLAYEFEALSITQHSHYGPTASNLTEPWDARRETLANGYNLDPLCALSTRSRRPEVLLCKRNILASDFQADLWKSTCQTISLFADGPCKRMRCSKPSIASTSCAVLLLLSKRLSKRLSIVTRTNSFQLQITRHRPPLVINGYAACVPPSRLRMRLHQDSPFHGRKNNIFVTSADSNFLDLRPRGSRVLVLLLPH